MREPKRRRREEGARTGEWRRLKGKSMKVKRSVRQEVQKDEDERERKCEDREGRERVLKETGTKCGVRSRGGQG